MDKITKSLVDAYAKSEQLNEYDASDQFAHFAMYSVVSKLYGDTFAVGELLTGGGNDTGIDGVAIFVNGVLIIDADQIKELAETNKYISAHFVFMQAKSGGNFNGGEIATFCFGVNEFFKDDPKLPRNGFIQEMVKVQQAVFTHGPLFRHGKPKITLYYVTTGKWTDDAAVQGRINSEIDQLRGTGLFANVAFIPVDADTLQDYYRQSQSKASAEFIFRDKITLSEMDGVTQAYLGVLPAKDYLRLVEGENDTILKSVFYDNVRDFQEYNDVNNGMRQTILSTHQQHFVLLNNGITVITRKLDTVGDKFFLEDYQIVNGCQTSHVLFDTRDDLKEEMFVPLKIIATEDDAIISKIIEATNSQTEVKADQLLALSAFQKKLESYFNAFGGGQKLYYERRSKQYNSNPEIEKVRIVTIPTQIRSFAAMFLDEAHRSHYVRSLQSMIGSKIFNRNHQLEAYYVSAYAAYKLEFLFRNRLIDSRFKPARYHLLMAARYQLVPGSLPALTSNQIKKISETMCPDLWDESKAVKLFKGAGDVIDRVVGSTSLTRDLMKTQPFTDAVLKAVGRKS